MRMFRRTSSGRSLMLGIGLGLRKREKGKSKDTGLRGSSDVCMCLWLAQSTDDRLQAFCLDFHHRLFLVWSFLPLVGVNGHRAHSLPSTLLPALCHLASSTSLSNRLPAKLETQVVPSFAYHSLFGARGECPPATNED